MGRVRLILISLVALVVALGAAFVARGLATPRTPKTVIVQAAPPPRPTVRVLTAKRDLGVGDRLDEGMVGWRDWPADGLSPNYITDGAAAAAAPTDATGKAAAAAGGAADAAKKVMGVGDAGMAAWIGATVREPLSSGEPVTARKVVRAGAGGVMAVTLQPGMRAMSVPLSVDNAAGGFILPGDHVDVVQIRKTADRVASSTVMRNVRVLAIDQNTRADAKASTQVGTSATLELAPEQAEDMVLARAQGDLTLVLRSYADAAGPARTGEMSRAAQDQQVVRVFRNGEETQVKVTR